MKNLFIAVMLLMAVVGTAQETTYTSDVISYWEYSDDIEQWEEIDIANTEVLVTFKNDETLIEYVDAPEQILLNNHEFLDTYINTSGRIINAYRCYYEGTEVLLTFDDLGDLRVRNGDIMIMFHALTKISG